MSAIDIPEVSKRSDELADRIRAHVWFAPLSGGGGDAAFRLSAVRQIAEDLGTSVDRVEVELDGRIEEVAVPLRVTRGSLLEEEFEAFCAAGGDRAPMEDFITRVESDVFSDSGLEGHGVADVVLVDRLREVRASVGFSRRTPDSTIVPSVPRGGHEAPWLPAVEGYGEGIFLKFDGDAVDTWASDAQVIARVAQISANQEPSVIGARLHPASAPYLLLHGLAHTLMRELAFKSGYSAPSLRERIYCEGEGDYGIFIYTTSSDIEGTLGGLVRQGERRHLPEAFARSLEQVRWCPNDPVCSEAAPHSISGLNLAACHACMLAPETSCESSNLLLDRVLLVGSADVPGFFESFMDASKLL